MSGPDPLADELLLLEFASAITGCGSFGDSFTFGPVLATSSANPATSLVSRWAASRFSGDRGRGSRRRSHQIDRNIGLPIREYPTPLRSR